jgi:hypothetical protein
MNEIFLAFVTFILGILATVATQFFNRKFQLQEQRQQKRIERLVEVEKWIYSYQGLFKCKYPQLKELVLAHRYVDPNYVEWIFDGDKTIPKRNEDAFIHLRDEMRKFKSTESKHKDTEKEAVFALRALGANTTKPNLVIRIILSLFRQHVVYIIANDFDLWYPKGFFKEIAPYLSELSKQNDKLFREFPRRFFYHIDWELLDTVEFEQFSNLLLPRFSSKKFPELPKSEDEKEKYWISFSSAKVFSEEEVELLESLDSMDSCRHSAERAIDDALLVIEKYKTEWL